MDNVERQLVADAVVEVQKDLDEYRKRWELQLLGVVSAGDERTRNEMLEFSHFMDQLFDLCQKIKKHPETGLFTDAIQMEFVLLTMDVIALILETGDFRKAYFMMEQVTNHALKAVVAAKFANRMVAALNAQNKEAEKLN